MDKERMLDHIPPINPERLGTVDDLYAVDEALLQELRQAGRDYGVVPLIRLMRLYATPECLPYTRLFIAEVIMGEEPISTWRRRRVLIPSYGISEMLTRPGTDLLRPLECMGAVSQRLVPTQESFSIGGRDVGAPAVYRDDLDYTWKREPGVIGRSPDEELEPIGDVSISVRRWIAARVAGAFLSTGKAEGLTTEEELLRLAEVERKDASEDAVAAVRGLLRESAGGLWSGDAVPGFAGPDDFYR